MLREKTTRSTQLVIFEKIFIVEMVIGVWTESSALHPNRNQIVIILILVKISLKIKNLIVQDGKELCPTVENISQFVLGASPLSKDKGKLLQRVFTCIDGDFL